MSFLLDTGILLRLIDKKDANHALVENAVDTLVIRRDELLITTQNIAELWNVATRPTANNGLALTSSSIAKLYDETVRPICQVLPETSSLANELMRLFVQYGGRRQTSTRRTSGGHDARLANRQPA